MSHPKKSDLLEYSKDLLSPEHKESVEEHLKICDSCMQEVEDSLALIERLGSWQDVEISDDYVVAQLQKLGMPGARREEPPFLKRFPAIANPLFRGAAIAATAVLCTITVQGLIWNPLFSKKQIKTVFELAPLPMDYPAGGAIPDTMIVVNVHADGSYSTSVFEGMYSMDALKSQLAREIEKGEYWTLAVNATNLRNPVTVRFKDLNFFKRKLGINEFRFWTDDVVSRVTGRTLTMEELEEIVGAGQPRIEVTLEGIDIKAMNQVNLAVGTDGRITIYGNRITMAEARELIRNYYTHHPDGELHIRYWESSIADSVRTVLKAIAENIGLSNVTYVKLGDR